MRAQAAVTVHRARDEVQRLWESPEYRSRHIDDLGAEVTFKDAPGDRGTEIHVAMDTSNGGLGGVLHKLTGSERLAKVKDDLRRFKQRVETGVIPRSDGSPEGELAERKLKQRPAQPLDEAELEKAGVS
ncbi:MAG TPA: hypothetical protein VHF51_11580 [Solirubrobacteraceae bacterium]|nr:hypothetical protein [Solirubrobacteraceae bacterium]